MRAVLDPNVLISGLLSPRGAPGQLLVRWLHGEFDLVVSDALLTELDPALAYPKLAARIPRTDAAEFVGLLRESAVLAADPLEPPPRSADQADDYLLALAEHERALLVSGGQHVLALADLFPVASPKGFLDTLVAEEPS